MLIATQGKNAAATQQYFEQVLSQGDYYLGQEIAGTWHGQGTELLDLERGSEVSNDQFEHLLNGRHPQTGEVLAQRQRKDRRPGVDLTFSVPKSVSLAWAINNDERIADLLRASVHETMTRDVEPLMQRRVRAGKDPNSRERTETGKLIYGDFLHKTSRPVDGKPDPHLHVHAFVINWTHHDGKHYAGEFAEIIRQRPSLQAKFEARLAEKLQSELGYDVQKVNYRQSGRMKVGWEIQGINRKTIEKFSQRTEQVENFAKEHGITDEAEKSKLGKKTREKKNKGTSIEELRKEWRSRLTESERGDFKELKPKQLNRDRTQDIENVNKALKHALDHHLFRQSTVEKHLILGTALEQAVAITPEKMEAAFNQLNLIQRTKQIDGAKRDFVTTREVLQSEQKIIGFARDGRGTKKSLSKGEHEFHRDWLNSQQKDAVRHVLASRDQVMAVMGGAGTGKTSLLQEVSGAIQRSGKELYTFAPSTGAKDVLQNKGFSNAQTVEHLLRNSELQTQVKDQVLWIDEAGLLDVRSMQGIFRIAKEQNTRVVLSGDTKQHSSPRRGAAFQLLEQEAGLKIARVEKIQRQKGQYKQAMMLIGKGHEIDPHSGKPGLVAGFDLLDQMGKIKEIKSDEKHTVLAEEYLESRSKGKSTLIVSPTHQEAGAVTQEIRAALKARRELPAKDHSVFQMRSLNLTDAEKRDAATYQGQDDLIVEFHQNVKGGFKKGDRFKVDGTNDQEVKLTHTESGNQVSLPASASDRFEVYQQQTVDVAAGDHIRFSLGGTCKNKKQRIANGRLDEIQRIDRSGNLVLKSGITINQNYGHLDLGYVITSHASQGKDRQIAMAAMGSESLPAINAKQFYVTTSRGKEDVMIFVDDKAKIRRAIASSRNELSATELMKERETSTSSQEHVPTRSAEPHQNSWTRGFQTARSRFMNWCQNRDDAVRGQLQTNSQRQSDLGRSIGGPSSGIGPASPSPGGN